MIKYYLFELLDEIAKAKDNQAKIDLIKKNDSQQLRNLFYANFSDKIQFLLPLEPTPYKPLAVPTGLAETHLMKELTKLYLFYRGGHPTLTQVKREQLWIQLLERLQDKEAEVLETLKNKDLTSRYGITRGLIERIYPNLLEAPAPTCVNPGPKVTLAPKVAPSDEPQRRGRGRPKGSPNKKKKDLESVPSIEPLG